MRIYDHLNALYRAELVEELTHLLLSSERVQTEHSNATAGLRAILQRPRLQKRPKGQKKLYTHTSLNHTLTVTRGAPGVVAWSRRLHTGVRARTGVRATTRSRTLVMTAAIVIHVRP